MKTAKLCRIAADRGSYEPRSMSEVRGGKTQAPRWGICADRERHGLRRGPRDTRAREVRCVELARALHCPTAAVLNVRHIVGSLTAAALLTVAPRAHAASDLEIDDRYEAHPRPAL